MLRIILLFGILAGACLTAALLIGTYLGDPATAGGWDDLLSILAMGLTLILVLYGIKHLRDRLVDRSIGFVRALLVGLGISAVAGIIHALTWTVYTVALVNTSNELWGSTEPISIPPLHHLLQFCWTFLRVFGIAAIVSVVGAYVLKDAHVWQKRTK